MNFFRWRQRKDEELNAEIQTHLDEAMRERMERGESAEEARRNTQREFGNVGLVKEVTREMWGWTSLALPGLNFVCCVPGWQAWVGGWTSWKAWGNIDVPRLSFAPAP